jgi:hypothetical protein
LVEVVGGRSIVNGNGYANFDEVLANVFQCGRIVPMHRRSHGVAMSHIHNIGGNLNTAAEYQEYLARLRYGRGSRRAEETAENRGVTTFDSAIDPDLGPDEDREGGDEEADENPEASAEDKQAPEGEENGHGLSAKA